MLEKFENLEIKSLHLIYGGDDCCYDEVEDDVKIHGTAMTNIKGGMVNLN
ncbi:hypothetical protein [Tenacibaculum sp. 190524A05c]